ncbi:MAG: MASE1 domain-containing protein [Pirellulaceae bacterium]
MSFILQQTSHAVMQRVAAHPGTARVFEALAIGLIYFALARLGQILAIEPGNVTPIWPVSGFALAVVLRRGYRVWPGLWLGNFLANTWAFLDTSTFADTIRTVATGLAIGPGDVLQACLGAYLIRRICLNGDPFNRTRDVFCFVGTQLIACFWSATPGVLALCLGGLVPWTSYGYTWLTWYLGDGIGVILVAPVFLSWRMILPVVRDYRRAAEATTILTLSLLASLVVFNDVFDLPLSFLPLPLVLWAAVRGDQFAVSATVLAISVGAIGGTFTEHGPFVSVNSNVSLISLQFYLAIMMVTGLAVATALSERQRSESELRQTDARLQQAMKGGNIGLWDWDVLSNQVYFSPQLKSQLGFDADSPWERYSEWETRVHPDDKRLAIQRAKDYLEGRSAEYTSTFRLRHKDGTYLWILSQGEAEWDEHGNPLRMIGVHIDITESKLHAEELERTNLELQQMAHAASHDLQEPLRTISNFSQLVSRRYGDQLEEDGQKWLDAIVRGTKRMRALITDLRAYAELDAGTRAFEPVNMQEVLDGALANLHRSIQESDAEVSHDHLPMTMGDKSELVQLLQNLISNALKFRRDGAPRVHISAKQDREAWVFSVRDNGIGIAAAHQERIFEVFRRLHHAREFPGTGIGLAICRRVVRRHHGDILVESELGRGSTFQFTIPIHASEDSR